MSIPVQSTRVSSNVVRRRDTPYVTPRGPWTRFKSRHPYASRVVRNLAVTGAVVAPLALASRRNFRRGMSAFSTQSGLSGPTHQTAKIMLKRAKRQRSAAIFLGGTMATGGILSPTAMWNTERRAKRRAQRNPYVVAVIDRKTGTRRTLNLTAK